MSNNMKESSVDVNLLTTWEVATPVNEIKKTDEQKIYIHFLKANKIYFPPKKSNNLR